MLQCVPLRRTSPHITYFSLPASGLISRYDTDKNGYVDHGEFLAKLGGELAPGDVHGPSTLIAEQSQHVMESMYKKQHVRIVCRLVLFIYFSYKRKDQLLLRAM